MAGIERRRFKRVSVRLPVKLYVSGWDNAIDAEIRNLSQGGAFIYCETEIPDGKKVIIELAFANREMLHAEVHDLGNVLSQGDGMSVRWRDGRGGFGVEFVDLKPDSVKLLVKLVDALEVRG